MKNYTEVEVSELSNTLAKNNVLLVDVRNDDEVARGVIEGAIHIQLSLLPLEYEKLTNADAVVFYCHSGIRSAHAADFAASKGIKSVYNLAGGVLAWAQAGYSLSHST
ncbi:MAG: rhodanese-like domain-containing protein [Methylophilaceae bacterium]|jgi:rhodanese-related sulfurtransferase